MITEDYVSFETAKLLKEKGFNTQCWMYYSPDTFGPKMFHTQRKGNSQLIPEWEECVCPTLQMAMKWLREVHNLHIEVYRTACGYLYIISKVPTGSDLYDNGDAYDGDDENSGQWTTYEKACEAAIKYCLENLI